MDQNILVLRKDIENNWNWTKEIIEELKKIKEDQENILKTIKDYEVNINFMLEYFLKEHIGYSNIIQNTNI